MDYKFPALDNPIVRTLALLAALLLIGLATRPPALQFPQLYALHGVLAAPFFSAVALWHFNRSGRVWQLALATLVLAGVLGAMSPVMGASFLLLAACLLVICGATVRMEPGKRGLARAVAFGALDYPCALAGGIASGSYVFSLDAVLTIVLLALLSASLSLLAAFAMSMSRRKAA